MAVKIRLRRTGRKKMPSYRVVVAESTTPRDGQYLDAVGTYNPLVKPAELRIDLEKVDRWLANGAEMTDTVASLIRKARRGGDDIVAVRGVGPDVQAAPADVGDAPAAPRKKAAPPKAGSRGAQAATPAAPAAAAAEPADEPAAAAEPADEPAAAADATAPDAAE